MRKKGGSPLIACTVIARNYLSHARVLARSFLQHHPESEFFLLVVDRLPEGVVAGAGARLVEPADLGCSYFRELCFKYEVIELCTAIKPTLLRFLMDRFQPATVLYLDPDILVLRRFSEVSAALAKSSLLLTPHLLTPLPLDGQKPSELDILACGAYNLGFLGLCNCEESRSFLDWWETRLRDGCLMERGGRHFVDQKWVDYAPSYFPGTSILRDETYNVAMWNLGSRRLDHREGTFFVDGRPLTFFHFSGFTAEGWKFEAHIEGRFDASKESNFGRLVTLYAQLQEESGFADCRNWKYGYACFDNGEPINTGMRRLYLSLKQEERERFPDPFAVNGPGSFYEWALTPRQDLANLSPFVLAVYRLRPDVIAAFPDVLGAHRNAFFEWVKITGSQEMGFDPRMVRGGDSAEGAPAPRTDPVWVRIADLSLTQVTVQDLVARWFDLPRRDQTFDASAVPISGWVLGRNEPVQEVEIVSSGQVICRTPVNIGRAEVAASHPNFQHAARCGFRVTASLEGQTDAELLVQGVFADGRRVPISVIRTRLASEDKE